MPASAPSALDTTMLAISGATILAAAAGCLCTAKPATGVTCVDGTQLNADGTQCIVTARPAGAAAAPARRSPPATRSDADAAGGFERQLGDPALAAAAAASAAVASAEAAAAAAEALCANTPGCQLLRFLHGHGLNHMFPSFRVAGFEYDAVIQAMEQLQDGTQAFAELGFEPCDLAALQLATAQEREFSSFRSARSSSSSLREAAPPSSAGVATRVESIYQELDATGEAVDLDGVRAYVEGRMVDKIRSWVIQDPAAEIEHQSYIAEGTSGKVYRGVWQGMPVAVKVYKGGSTNAATFQNEVELMRRMQHQSILRLYGASLDPSSPIIVSELCVGSLSSLLYGKISNAAGTAARLTERWEAIFVRGIATGMAFLHKHNVVHRDLKSANILFDRGLMPKLCDFAFSKHTGSTAVRQQPEPEPEPEPDDSVYDVDDCDLACQIRKKKKRDLVRESASDADLSDAVVGTPQWCAPEVLRGDAYSTKADVWSCGVVIWEIINRAPPHADLPSIAVMHKVASEGLKLQHAPGSDGGSDFWRRLMDSAWAEQPADRPSFDAIVLQMIAEMPARQHRAEKKPTPAAVVATLRTKTGSC